MDLSFLLTVSLNLSLIELCTVLLSLTLTLLLLQSLSWNMFFRAVVLLENRLSYLFQITHFLNKKIYLKDTKLMQKNFCRMLPCGEVCPLQPYNITASIKFQNFFPQTLETFKCFHFCCNILGFSCVHVGILVSFIMKLFHH